MWLRDIVWEKGRRIREDPKICMDRPGGKKSQVLENMKGRI